MNIKALLKGGRTAVKSSLRHVSGVLGGGSPCAPAFVFQAVKDAGAHWMSEPWLCLDPFGMERPLLGGPALGSN